MRYDFLKKLKFDDIKGAINKIFSNIEFNYKQDNKGKQKIDIKLDKDSVKGDVNISIEDKEKIPVISAKIRKSDDRSFREN